MKKGDLYFVRSDGERILLLKDCTENEAANKRRDFLNEHEFKSYYCRMWYNEDGTELWWDFGSHVEFMVWVTGGTDAV